MKTILKFLSFVCLIVLFSNEVVAQQSLSTETNTIPVTVFRMANPNYKEEVTTTVKETSERTKNPNAEKENNAQMKEQETVITNEKVKNNAH